MAERGWASCDIVLVSGDAYVDHPAYGTAVIGRVLEDAGFKVGIIAQPDWKNSAAFEIFGRPKLFFGISGGNLDSILSNYSVNRKPRRTDEYSPGGKPGLRPNRASIVYANKVKEIFPGVPVVLGGLEASMRRLAHYDYWSDEVRRSILIDAKADLLVYGMGEKAAVEIAIRLGRGEEIKNLTGIRGTVAVRNSAADFKDALQIPAFEDIKDDKDKFTEAFKAAYLECDPVRGRTVLQRHGDRYVVQFPPALPLATPELDRIYLLPYARAWHPSYDRQGGIPGFEVVRFSIVSHRGCPGECSFCSLYAHQGRILQSRSRESILEEAARIADQKDFRGTIHDIGGPTANLYGASCESWGTCGACRDKNCLAPEKCGSLKLAYDETVDLWAEVLKIPKVKHLFISSGLRHDLLVEKSADRYLEALCRDHISGRLKVAPEHCSDHVLKLMGKTPFRKYETFREKFYAVNARLGKHQYLVNYFVSAHPGAGLKDALALALYLVEKKIHPEQIQDFIPLPMTVSGCMYHTGRNPLTGERVYTAKDPLERHLQRALLQYKQPINRKYALEALKRLGRPDLKKIFCEWGGGGHRGGGRARGGRNRREHKGGDGYESWEL